MQNEKETNKGEVVIQVRLPDVIKDKLYELAKLDQRKGANLARKVLIEFVVEHSEGIDLKEISMD